MSKLSRCMLKLVRDMKPFDTVSVVEAGKVYQTRGKAEDDANASAIEDHLADLRAQRLAIVDKVMAEYKARMPERFAVAAVAPAAEPTAASAPAKAAPVSKAAVGKPLYASRPVLNADDIIAWAQSQGFETTLPAADMHVTVAYSTAPIDGGAVPAADASVVVLGGKRSVEPLGDEGAVVLKFASNPMQARWQQYRVAGASWDYESYQPHITITYDGQGVDLAKVEPYRGAIKLGPEKQEPLNEDKADEYVEKPTAAAKSAKPRLAESADGLWKAIKELAGGRVSKNGGGILYPQAQVIAGERYQVKPDGSIQVVTDRGVGVRDATEAEAQELHDAIDADQVQVNLMTKWGGSGADVYQTKVDEILHSPSGNSWAQRGAATKAPSAETKPASTRPEPVKPETKPASRETPAKIGDSGEELKANRRNQAPGGLKWADVEGLNPTLRVAEVTKEKVWPRPDYAAMVESGAHPFAAHIVKQVYDKIATAPQVKGAPTDADLQRYIAVVNRIRAAMAGWASDKGAQARMIEGIAGLGKAATSYGSQIELSKLMTAGEKPLLDQVFPGDDRRRFRNDAEAAKDARIAGGNGLIHVLQPGYEAAKRALKALGEGWPAKQEAWQRSFDVRENELRANDVPGVDAGAGPQKRWQVYMKGSTFRLAKDHPDGGFATQDEALAWARDQVKRSRQEDEPDAKPLELAERLGEARRPNGENVTSGQLRDAFGFRGVNFGNWMPQDERQAHLNHAYDALLDLAALLNVPPKALSLNGALGVAFGAQGKGSAAAHFVPGLNEINLTRTGGVGALAHEWGHAVDHYFGTQDGERVARAARPYMSAVAAPGVKAEGARQEIVDAFAALVKAMRKTVETRAAYAERIAKMQERAVRNLNGWLTNARQTLDGKPEAHAKFDAFAEQLRTGDLGDGWVQIGFGKEKAIKPTTAALRELVREHTGRLLPADTALAIDGWAHSVELYRDREKFMADHQPQEVATEFDKASGYRDAKKTKPYWQTPWEMFARAFETYVIDRLARDNARNDYLSDADRWARYEEAGRLEGPNPYPKGAEREAINAAFDELVGALKTRETDAGVALFSRGPTRQPPYAAPEAYRFHQRTDAKGLPAFISDELAIGRARVKDALGVPAGGRALAFDIVDRRIQDAKGKAKKVGEVLVHMDADGKFASLRNIQIDPVYRARGHYHGEGVVVGMLQHNGATPMEIFNIQSAAKGDDDDALPFWKHIGTTILNNSSDPDMIIEGNISLARYVSRGKKRGEYGQSRRGGGEQPVSRGDEALGGEPDAGGTRRSSGVESGQSGTGGADGRSGTAGDLIAKTKRAPQSPATAGLSLSEARAFADGLTANWENAPPVTVLATPADAPFDAPDDANGALYRGQVYLFASNLRDAAELQFTLFHETLGHVGLRGMLGAGMDAELRRVANLNAGVRKAAATWSERFGSDAVRQRVESGMTRAEARAAVNLLALEEALADMAGSGKPITGLQRFMAKVQELLRAIGFERVANWLESATDAEVASLLAKARAWVEGDTHVTTTGELAATYSRALEDIAPTGAERIFYTDTLAEQETKRVSAMRELRKLRKRLEDGDIGESDFVERAQELLDRLEEQAANKAGTFKARARGAEWLRERLMRARRTGELAIDTVNFALWAIDKNPDMVERLGISIRKQGPGEKGVAGTYEPFSRIITLFKNVDDKPDVAVHEILHHAERLMPPAVQKAISKQWTVQVVEAMKVAVGELDTARLDLLEKMVSAVLGDTKALADVRKGFTDGVLSYDDYQLTSPSEFWAVNGARIMSARAEASESWVDQARQWIKELLQHIKGLLKLSSDAPVLKGLSNVLKSDGTELSPNVLALAFDHLMSLQEADLLAAYDEAALKAKTDREEAARKAEEKRRADALKPPARRVRAEQVDVFAEQGALFSRASAAQAAVQPSLRERARQAIMRADSVIEPLGNLPAQKAYLTGRYLALGRIANVDDIAKKVGDMFHKATAADRAAAYEYLTTAGASPLTIVGEETRRQTMTVKRLIGSVGDALVARGLLSEEAREEYRDRYLPRLYLKHVLSESDWSALGGGKKVSDMGYLKARKDIPEEVRAVILGEITDPGFLAATGIAKPMRDMALLDWLASIAGNTEWVDKGSVAQWQGARVSVRWLQLEAARLRKQAAYYTPENAAKALAMAKDMDAVVDAATEGAAPDPALYKQIPDTARYGRLRGSWVRREIYDDMMGVADFLPQDAGWWQSIVGYGGVGTRVTQLWKLSKVALNPPGQVRNFVSNMVMLQLSGVPLHRLPDTMIRAARQIMSDGPMYKIAKKYGVTASTFSNQELGRIRTDLLNLEARTKGLHPLVRMKMLFGIIANGASDLYQFTETMFKTAKIMDGIQRQKMPEAEAAIEAHKWMFDYSLVSQNVRYMRNAPIGVPFVTYFTKVLPRLLEAALLHPQRLLPWVGLYYALPALAASAFGVDEDDLDKLKKALPEWLQKRGNAFFLPYKDELGRVQAVDLGYFFPWGQWQEFAGALAETAKSMVDGKSPAGGLSEAMRAAGLFSGPVTDVVVAMKTNEDSFTGRDIINKADPPARQAAALANYMWDMAMPPFIGSRGILSPMGLIDEQYGGKAVQAALGTTNKFGEPRNTAEQAALALFGVNLYAVDPDHTRATNLLMRQRDMQDVEARLKQQLTDRGLSEERRQRLVSDYLAEIGRRTADMQEYIAASEVHPNLKAGQQ